MVASGGFAETLPFCFFLCEDAGPKPPSSGANADASRERDVGVGPLLGHAVGEAGGVVDDEDVGLAADAEAFCALLELLFADVAEAVCVAWE